MVLWKSKMSEFFLFESLLLEVILCLDSSLDKKLNDPKMSEKTSSHGVIGSERVAQ